MHLFHTTQENYVLILTKIKALCQIIPLNDNFIPAHQSVQTCPDVPVITGVTQLPCSNNADRGEEFTLVTMSGTLCACTRGG